MVLLAGGLMCLTSSRELSSKFPNINDVKEITIEKSKSGNPMLGFDQNGNILYGGDPSILVDGDTVYAYVGHDTSTRESYYMPDWQCYSSTNMKDWKYEGEILSSS